MLSAYQGYRNVFCNALFDTLNIKPAVQRRSLCKLSRIIISILLLCKLKNTGLNKSRIYLHKNKNKDEYLSLMFNNIIFNH